MTVDSPALVTAAPAAAPASAPTQRSLLPGALTMIGTAMSNQTGAALGAHAFPVLGPPGVVAIRQIAAAAVLVPIARPRFWRFTWSQWWPTLLLALVLACMNLSLYFSIDRIGLGLAVTLEFLGPLGVALVASRSRIDLVCALGAGLGVYVLVKPGASTDYLGVGLALTAAGCWAAYILLQRLIGRRLSGLEAPAVATSITALVYLPVLIGLGLAGRLTGTPVLYALAAGLLCSAVPYAMDLITLRFVPARLFGVFMSVNPVTAALSGLIVLGQVLHLHTWVGIGLVVTANLVTVVAANRRVAR